MRLKRILMLILAAATLGLAAFDYMVWNAVTFERADESDAARQFLAARAGFGSALLECKAHVFCITHYTKRDSDKKACKCYVVSTT